MRAGTHAFRYDLVSWDEDQDQRVYCLAPVTLDAFDRAVEALQGLGEPTWPFWNPVWIFTTEECRIAAERILDTLVGTGEYNIAVFTKDLSRRVEEAVSLSEERRKLATKFKIDRVIQSFHLWSHRA